MIAAPPRRRYTRSTCFLCINGAKHKHCRICGAILVGDQRMCSICEWEGPRAKTNHELLEPIIFLLREIFRPQGKGHWNKRYEVMKSAKPRPFDNLGANEAVLAGTGSGDAAAKGFR